MRKIAILLSTLLSGLAVAKICDQSYHFQEAYQYIFTGTSKTGLTASAPTKLDKQMKSAALLSDSTAYKILTDWDASGSCDGWVKREVTFAIRDRAAKSFQTSTSSDNSVRFFDGAYTYKTPGWDEYWFGIADTIQGSTAILAEEVGKFKNQSMLNIWYGAARIKITTRTKNGALVDTGSGYLLTAASHPDSAALASVLLSSWDNVKIADTQTVDYTLQLIRIRYDSMPSPAGLAKGPKATVGSFLARQTGNLVLIQTGEKAAESGPIALYNMLGSKIATLHPTGFLYQWNGKTAVGADAPTGVYFVQAGNRVLGKFFYSH
jgi:hypothetical protein